ncbi:MAG: glycosyltransferase [Dysgonamonadaceae bacterium]|jgi:glycosyltransferase involved in cell wall biosynthesis|nr:glycosyltransferase [Dysgonamonadaceae bacterium]
MEKVSLIIPVYNVEKLLPKCLDSAMGQTYPELEIIVVNDGSPDRSDRVIAGYAAKDSRIVTVNKPNGGLSDARNAGMKVATGQYLCFLDGDDWLDSDFVERMLNQMITNQLDLVCCDYRYVWADGHSIDKHFLDGLPPAFSQREAIAAFLKQQMLASVAIKMFRRQLCLENQLEFEQGVLWEDLLFTMQYLFHCKKVGIIDGCPYNYFQADVSISRSKETLNVLHWMRSALRCVEMNENHFPGIFTGEEKCFLAKAFIGVLVYSFKCKDKTIRNELKKELKKRNSQIGLSYLSLSEKVLINLYRINYRIAQLIFLQIYKKLQEK